MDIGVLQDMLHINLDFLQLALSYVQRLDIILETGLLHAASLLVRGGVDLVGMVERVHLDTIGMLPVDRPGPTSTLHLEKRKKVRRT
jgi:hypothetical protein